MIKGTKCYTALPTKSTTLRASTSISQCEVCFGASHLVNKSVEHCQPNPLDERALMLFCTAEAHYRLQEVNMLDRLVISSDHSISFDAMSDSSFTSTFLFQACPLPWSTICAIHTAKWYIPRPNARSFKPLQKKPSQEINAAI